MIVYLEGMADYLPDWLIANMPLTAAGVILLSRTEGVHIFSSRHSPSFRYALSEASQPRRNKKITEPLSLQ